MSADQAPSVDILLAVFNGEAFLAEQIESIQAQSHSRWTLLISDDGSSDGSMAIANAYAERDERIRVLAGGRAWGSAERHFRYLLGRSSAEYVMFCDQDDVWLPGKIEVTLDAVAGAEYPQGRDRIPVLGFTDVAVVDEDLRVLDPSFMHYSRIDPYNLSLQRLLAQNSVNGCTALMNRPLVDLVNLTPPETYVRMHDRWVALVAAGLGRIVYVDDASMLYRQHSANAVGAARHPLARLEDFARYRQSMLESIKAAQSFTRVYGQLLPDDAARVAAAYGELARVGRLKRLAILLRFRTLKAGTTRCLGQVLVTMLIQREPGRPAPGRG